VGKAWPGRRGARTPTLHPNPRPVPASSPPSPAPGARSARGWLSYWSLLRHPPRRSRARQAQSAPKRRGGGGGQGPAPERRGQVGGDGGALARRREQGADPLPRCRARASGTRADRGRMRRRVHVEVVGRGACGSALLQASRHAPRRNPGGHLGRGAERRLHHLAGEGRRPPLSRLVAGPRASRPRPRSTSSILASSKGSSSSPATTQRGGSMPPSSPAASAIAAVEVAGWAAPGRGRLTTVRALAARNALLGGFGVVGGRPLSVFGRGRAAPERAPQAAFLSDLGRSSPPSYQSSSTSVTAPRRDGARHHRRSPRRTTSAREPRRAGSEARAARPPAVRRLPARLRRRPFGKVLVVDPCRA